MSEDSLIRNLGVKVASGERRLESVGRVRVDEKLLGGVEVQLEARLGTATLPLAELMALSAGSLVPIDTPLGGAIDILLQSMR